MPRQKKRVEIQELKRWANSILATPEGEAAHITAEFKDGICTFLEKALREANAYQGYVFVFPSQTDIHTYGHVSRQYL